MRSGFLPVRDLDLLTWSITAARRIEADADAYGLSNAEVAAFVEAQSRFAEAMERVRPAIRSSSSVIVKEEARVALEVAARKLNVQVRGAGVADDEKLCVLGLTIHKTSYRRIGRPEMRPKVCVLSVNGPTIKLAVSEANSLRIALPDDVASVAVYQWIGDDVPRDFDRWTVTANIARARLTLILNAPLGTPVRFVARYLNRRGECGAWGTFTSTHALGGMVFSRNLLTASSLLRSGISDPQHAIAARTTPSRGPRSL
jgi:hypothetical protein